MLDQLFRRRRREGGTPRRQERRNRRVSCRTTRRSERSRRDHLPQPRPRPRNAFARPERPAVPARRFRHPTHPRTVLIMLRTILLTLAFVASSFSAEEITFRNHVQPVLSKTGCNAGACHGAAAGQNGFRLSLRGYDDEGDYVTLTRQALGRRINPADPGRSLLLLKSTGTIPHKGGKRFEVDSVEYKILADWIASGTPGPKDSDPRIERIEVSPAHIILTNGAAQQLAVRAFFNNGKSEDVTRWVKYTAANASVATVDDSGKVNVVG